MSEPNACIGPYTLHKKLGRGAFGVVWLASKRTALSEHQVALKLPTADEIDIEAIRQEAIVWEAAKGHPNIVAIIEADIYDGQVVIASEYVPDGSLGDWLHKHGGGAPNLEAAVSMTLGILAGLEHLHGRRIIHRDLKPANILLQANTPRLADFGLARCLKSTNSSSTVSGTFAFMSPEAFDGKRMEQSDLWAAGVMLYQMLARSLPFPQSDSPALLAAILTREPEPLPAEAPPALRAVVERALRKDPLERYPTAAAMSADLRAASQQQISFSSEKTLVMSAGASDATVPLFTLPSANNPSAPTQIENVPPPAKTALSSALVVVAVVMMLLTAGVAISRRWTQLANTRPPLVEKNRENKPPLSRKSEAPPLDGVSPHAESLPDGVKLELTPLPAGRFQMGAPQQEGESEREGPTHEVNIKRPFYIGKYEVTQAQWQAVMGENPARFNGDLQRPVENVNWVEAQEFCERLSDLTGRHYRLLTEAEWEYAARAGSSNPYAGDLDALAWHEGNSNGVTHTVGAKQPNAFGIYDMHGNLSEWCEDVWHENYKGAPADGSAWLTGGDAGIRLLRGGSWGNSPRLLRSAYRSDSFGSNVRSNLIGFRVAVNAK